jgi:hypothetical protein
MLPCWDPRGKFFAEFFPPDSLIDGSQALWALPVVQINANRCGWRQRGPRPAFHVAEILEFSGGRSKQMGPLPVTISALFDWRSSTSAGSRAGGRGYGVGGLRGATRGG